MNLRYRRPLILVVDEDERLASALRSAVAPEGFGVVNVADGKAALDRIRAMQQPPRLIFLEPDCPGIPGSALIGELASDARFAGRVRTHRAGNGGCRRATPRSPS